MATTSWFSVLQLDTTEALAQTPCELWKTRASQYWLNADPRFHAPAASRCYLTRYGEARPMAHLTS
jgi:hypothetical protein